MCRVGRHRKQGDVPACNSNEQSRRGFVVNSYDSGHPIRVWAHDVSPRWFSLAHCGHHSVSIGAEPMVFTLVKRHSLSLALSRLRNGCWPKRGRNLSKATGR